MTSFSFIIVSPIIHTYKFDSINSFDPDQTFKILLIFAALSQLCFYRHIYCNFSPLFWHVNFIPLVSFKTHSLCMLLLFFLSSIYIFPSFQLKVFLINFCLLIYHLSIFLLLFNPHVVTPSCMSIHLITTNEL